MSYTKSNKHNFQLTVTYVITINAWLVNSYYLSCINNLITWKNTQCGLNKFRALHYTTVKSVLTIRIKIILQFELPKWMKFLTLDLPGKLLTLYYSTCFLMEFGLNGFGLKLSILLQWKLVVYTLRGSARWWTNNPWNCMNNLNRIYTILQYSVCVGLCYFLIFNNWVHQ